MYEEFTTIEKLHGLTLSSVEAHEDEIIFTAVTGERFKMYHEQDCCESVTVDDVCGDWDDLIGEPLLIAEETSSADAVHHYGQGDLALDTSVNHAESETWTYYRLGTRKGGVTIRWYGASNGYYSEAVYLCQLDARND